MKRLILAAVAALVLGGCPAANQVDTRLEVNDRLRARCPLFDDGFIETLLLAYESDRLAGATRRELEQASAAECQELDIQALTGNCYECSFAIIAQVYGD